MLARVSVLLRWLPALALLASQSACRPQLVDQAPPNLFPKVITATPTPTPTPTQTPTLTPTLTPTPTSTPTPSSYSQLMQYQGADHLWQFEELSASPALDAIGGFAGTYQGAPSFCAVGPFTPACALGFDGISAHVELPNLDRNTFTVSALLKRNRRSSGRTRPDRLLMSAGNDGWGIGFTSLVDNPGHDQLFLSRTGHSLVADSATVADNCWHHIAVTYEGTQACFYVDGVQNSCQAYAQTFTGGSYYTIGSRGPADFLDGLLDELALFPSVLSTSDVQAQFTFAQTQLTAASAGCGALTSNVTGPPASYSYGAIPASTTAVHSFVLNNAGNDNAGPLRITFDVGSAFSVTADTCSGEVPAGSSCTIDVTFSATAALPYNDVVHFNDGGTSFSFDVPIDGSGF